MTHKIYVAKRTDQKLGTYIVVHTSTDWSQKTLKYQKRIGFRHLSGYLEGVYASTMGDLRVINGVPMSLYRVLKFPPCRPLDQVDLAKLLRSSDIL